MESAAPVDDAVLEILRQRGATHPLVERVRTERTGATLSTVVLVLDGDRYPDSVGDARLEIQWFVNGDYNVHYVETRGESVWQCRWDRHVNPHTARSHFHPPPDAASEAAVPDRPEDGHPGAMFARTMANVRDRMEGLWEG